MRPTFLFSCMIFIIMSFSFCTKLLDADKKLTDDNIPIEVETLFHHNGDLEDTISAESTTLSIPFLFTATEDWEAMSSDDSWLIVNTSKGEAKERITLDISTRKNIKAKTRRARIFVKTSQDSFSLYIIQQVVDGSLPTEGNGTLVYDKSYDLDQIIYADATTLNADFVFKATESWTAVSSDKSWLTVSPMGDKGSDISLAVFTSNNRTEAERTATIILSTSKDEVILTVTQLHTIDEDGTTLPPSTAATLIYDEDYDFTPILYAGDIALPTPFLFEATLAWDVTKENVIGLNADWVIIAPVNGAIGSGISLGVTTIPNVTGNTRVATVRLFTSEDEVSLIITQRATDEDGNIITTIEYDRDYDLDQSIYADATTLNADFVFTTTEIWTAVKEYVSGEGNADWVTLDKGSSGGGIETGHTLGVKTSVNYTQEARIVTITISTSKTTVVLTIIQSATNEDGDYPSSIDVSRGLSQGMLFRAPLMQNKESDQRSETREVYANITSVTPRFFFTAYLDWEVTKSEGADWIIIGKDNGTAGEHALNFSTTVNRTGVERTATITITAVYSSVELIIIQSATNEDGSSPLPDDTITEGVRDIDADDTTLDPPFTFTARLPWEATKLEGVDWVTIVNSTGGASEQRQTLNVATLENYTGEPRAATVTITTEYGEVTLVINQSATIDDETTILTTIISAQDGDDQAIYADATVLNDDFVFTATEGWTSSKTTDAEWLTIDADGAKGDDQILAVTTAVNYTGVERSATITLTTPTETLYNRTGITMTVTQSATTGDGNTIPSSIVSDQDNTTQRVLSQHTSLTTPFTFTAGLDWEVTKTLDATWITINTDSGEAGTYDLDITIARNSTKIERSTTVTVETLYGEVTLIIIQESSTENIVYHRTEGKLEEEILAAGLVFDELKQLTIISKPSTIRLNHRDAYYLTWNMIQSPPHNTEDGASGLHYLDLYETPNTSIISLNPEGYSDADFENSYNAEDPTQVAAGSFMVYTHLRDIILPKGLENAYNGMFDSNPFLDHVVFPGTLKQIQYMSISESSNGSPPGMSKIYFLSKDADNGLPYIYWAGFGGNPMVDGWEGWYYANPFAGCTEDYEIYIKEGQEIDMSQWGFFTTGWLGVGQRDILVIVDELPDR